MRGSPGLQTAMVGRRDRLSRLRSRLDSVCQSQQMEAVLVTGQAGVGKSRLVLEFRNSLAEHHQDVVLYEASCLAYGRGRPYWLIADLVRSIVSVSENDDPHFQLNELRIYLGELETQSTDTLTFLAHLLGLGNSVPEIAARLSLYQADMLQKLTHEAVRQVLLAEATLAPTVLVLEDLHWVDDASRNLIQHLIRTISNAPILLIMVSRGDNREQIQPWLSSAQHVGGQMAHIRLKSLSAAESQTLVDQLIRRATSEAEKIKEQIVARAAGNPFYTEEIIRMLIDEGGLVWEDGVCHVTPHADSLMQQVPGTLQGLILARSDSLEDDIRYTLQQAAVLGATFPARLLLALSNEPDEVVRRRMHVLKTRQFLVADLPDKGEHLAFRHTLIQSTIYNTLLKRNRQHLHDQAAAAIERNNLWLQDGRVETLAYHLSRGAKAEAAIPYLLNAAENAAERFANETAAKHYGQVLDLSEGPSDSCDETYFRATIGLGRALKLLGKYGEADQVLSNLQKLLACSTVIDPEILIPILVEGLIELADIQQREGSYESAVSHLGAGLEALGLSGRDEKPTLYRSLIERLAFVRFRQGKLDEAYDLAFQATTGVQPDEVDDPVTLASLYNTLGGISWQLGDIEDAILHVERSLRLYRSLGYRWGIAHSYDNLGILNAQWGNWKEAIAHWERSLAIRKEIGDILSQATSLTNLGQLRLLMGLHDEAKRNLEKGLAVFEQLGDDWSTAQVLVSLSQLAITQNELDHAARHVDRALSLADEVEGQSVQIQARWVKALIYAKHNELQQGFQAANQALQMAKDAGLMTEQAECLYVIGLLHTRHSDFIEAETSLKQSEEICRQMIDHYRQGLVLMALGELYDQVATSDLPSRVHWRTQAREALKEAAAIFSRLGANFDLQKASGLLSEVEIGIAADHAAAADQALGAPPLTTASHLDGERHLATVLWLNLLLPADTDDETVFETIALLSPACAAIAQEYGGHVRHLPDGITVTFGAPVAHEDDPERAVQSAYHIDRYLQQESRRGELHVTYRMGIDQGEIVGGHIKRKYPEQFVIQGEPVERAKQAASLAHPGKIWVTAGVRLRTERLVNYRPAPILEECPVPFWELVDLKAKPGPARDIPGVRARFIGRESYLAAMMNLYRKLKQGIGGIIWIEGEAGIGKSRLMREFRSNLVIGENTIWSGGCSAQRSHHAFSLFSNLLVHACKLQPLDSPEQIRHKIGKAVQSWPKDAQSTRPYLEVLVGIEPSRAEKRRLATLRPDQLRQQIFVAVRRLLKSLAKRRPIVLILDDLHWIDPMSAELLLFISTIVASDPILLVCAQRREGSDSPNDRLVRLQTLLPGQTVRALLERFSASESEQLIRELIPEADLPSDFFANVVSHSEGNPYFIEEFLRMFLEQGYLRRADGGWRVRPFFRSRDVPVPGSLEALIRSRVDALPSELKMTAQFATIIGDEFETSLLQEITELPNVGLALERLAARLILVRGPDADRWHFSHHLFESVVYKSLLKARRQELHLKLARVLENRWRASAHDHAEELAHHFFQAGAEIRALPYLVSAGERASARNANEAALVHFQRAANILISQEEPDEQLQWRIAVGLGDVYRFVGKYVESTAVLESGLPLAQTGRLFSPQRAGLYRRLGETAQKQGEYEKAQKYFTMTRLLLDQFDEPQVDLEAARTLIGLAWVYFAQGRFDQARQACEQTLQRATETEGLGELAAAENLLGGIHYHMGEWRAALHCTTRAMVLREQMGYTWGVAATLSNLGILSFTAGHWTKALDFFSRSLHMRQEMGDVEGVAITHNNLGMVYRAQGELDEAEDHFRESLEVAEMFKITYHVANATTGLASILLRKGDIRTAQETLTEGLEQAKAIGAQDIQAEMHRVNAEILLFQDDLESAQDEARQAASLSAEIGNRSYESAGWRVAAEVARRQGSLDVASAYVARAQKALAEVMDELEQGRVSMQAGRIHIDEGDVEQAGNELRSAKQIFSRLGAKLYLRELETIHVI